MLSHCCIPDALCQGWDFSVLFKHHCSPIEVCLCVCERESSHAPESIWRSDVLWQWSFVRRLPWRVMAIVCSSPAHSHSSSQSEHTSCLKRLNHAFPLVVFIFPSSPSSYSHATCTVAQQTLHSYTWLHRSPTMLSIIHSLTLLNLICIIIVHCILCWMPTDCSQSASTEVFKWSLKCPSWYFMTSSPWKNKLNCNKVIHRIKLFVLFYIYTWCMWAAG